MSSSSIPSPTRHSRKLSDAPGNSYGTSRYGRPPTAEGGNSIDGNLPSLERRTTAPRSGQSPSRLPVKPPTTRTTASTTRPPSAGSNVSQSTSMRPPPPRANTSKPTTSSNGLQRSTSTKRPNETARPPSGLQRSTSTRQTTESTSSNASNGLQRSTSTRRPSDASNKPLTTDPVKQDRSRPPLTQYKHLRSGSTSISTSNPSSSSSSTNIPVRGHIRARSASTTQSSQSMTHIRPPSRDSANPPKPQLHQDAPSLLQAKKAGFSTYQQHFSPAKSLAPKPHPAAFLAPPSPSKLPSNIAISAETAKLQNELLQLHLLHRDVETVRNQWQRSAKRQLGDRFHDVVRQHESLVALEAEEGARISAVAWKKWADCGVPGLGLEDKVRILDEILAGTMNLSDATGGKHTRLVRKFERWLAKSQAILEAREAGDGLSDGDEVVVFIEELDQTWKDECALITRKVKSWEAQLRDLGVPEGNESALRTVLTGCADLVAGMREELSEMSRLEDEMMRRESDWIKGLNQEGMSDDEEDAAVGNGKRVAGAIWRVI